MAFSMDSCMGAAWNSRHHSTDTATAGTGSGQPAKSLFVVNIEGRRHNGPLLIGLMDYFERHLSRVVRCANYDVSHHLIVIKCCCVAL